MGDQPPQLPTLPRPKSFAKNSQNLISKSAPPSDYVAPTIPLRVEYNATAASIKVHCNSLLASCFVQLLMAVGMMSFGAGAEDIQETDQFFVISGGFIALLSAIFGMLGVAMLNRNFLLFFFINQIWSLSNVCTVLLTNMQEVGRENAGCEMIAKGDFDAEDVPFDCEGGSSQKIVASAICLFVLWISAFVGQSLSELIQDKDQLNQDMALKAGMGAMKDEMISRIQALEAYVQSKLPKDGPIRQANKQPSFPRNR